MIEPEATAPPRPIIVVADVWDAPTRWFHWINALTVLSLVGLGLAILNGSALGLSNDGKVLLKKLHVWVGYIFFLNLLWRFLWGFLGNRYARWRAVLPGGRGYWRALGSYTVALLSGRPHPYVGHNPIGRLAITLMLILLLVQGVTGLVLAGTDIYYPPLGGYFAEWVAAPGVDPGAVAPYRPDLVDASAYEAMRDFRAPFYETHELLFFVLAAVIVIHVAGVVFTELWEGGTLTSAMFSGRKFLTRKPVDALPGEEETDAS